MKIVLVALLLVSCTLAVDWTTYSCADMAAFTPSSFNCNHWATFPPPSAPCLIAPTACGVLNQCSELAVVLGNALTSACTFPNRLTGSTVFRP